MNFYTNVFLLDMFISPHLIPGSEEVTRTPFINSMNVYGMIKGMFKGSIEVFEYKIIVRFMFTFIITLIILIVLVVIAFAFRFAIKSTSISTWGSSA
jgi:hypothetical protein